MELMDLLIIIIPSNKQKILSTKHNKIIHALKYWAVLKICIRSVWFTFLERKNIIADDVKNKIPTIKIINF